MNKSTDTESKIREQHIGSVFDNEQDLLKTIIHLHTPNGIELDPMYFKGNFYKDIQKPKYIFDIQPIQEECQKGDSTSLPLDDNSINSMILDPPFIFGTHGKDGTHQRNYYSSSTHGIFNNFGELTELYKKILQEAYRVLKNRGILIFKCQDYTDNKTTMTHCWVFNWAIQLGFYAKDIAILHLSKGKISNPNFTQRHLRKHHSYFWVFQK